MMTPFTLSSPGHQSCSVRSRPYPATPEPLDGWSAVVNATHRNTTSLLIRGFGHSGSGLLVDLLAGYSAIAEIPGEFDDFRRFGMIGDHLAGLIDEHYPSRLKGLADERLQPLENRRLAAQILVNLKRRVIGLEPIRVPANAAVLRERFRLLTSLESALGNHPEPEHLEIVVRWMDDLIKLFASERGFILFDQPLVQQVHDATWPTVFAPFVSFEVFRDPRDQLADLYRETIASPHPVGFWLQDALEWSGVRSREVILKSLAEIIRARYRKATASAASIQLHGLGSAYRIPFEALVAGGPGAVAELERLIGLNESQRPRSHLRYRPELSAKNIGIHHDVLTASECRIVDDLMDLVSEWRSASPI